MGTINAVTALPKTVSQPTQNERSVNGMALPLDGSNVVRMLCVGWDVILCLS